jgi:glycosyltransferase involved in cell wall biosynthesis
MRVGIDYTAAVRQQAGIGRYTRGLIAALAELDHETRYVLFSAGRDPSGRAWPANFRWRALPLTDRHLSLLWQRLRVPLPVEAFTGRLDLFHSPDFVLPPVARARTVLTVHDLSFMRYPECSSKPLLDYLMRSVPPAVRRADAILADSESTRRDLVELLQVEPERITVVYPGVEPHFCPGGDDAAVPATLARYGIRRPYLLGVGTLQPRKNFCLLIRAYHALRQQRRIPHQLVIAGGRGWLFDEIHDTIRTLYLEEQVQLTGFVADGDLPALYRGADVFAFPSLYEGFGIPVLEAMACGTPVVTSTASSLPEAAGEAALLVDPNDVDALTEALWRVIEDSALRNALCARGFEQVKRFSWAESARRLQAVYYAVGNGG